MIIDHDSRTLYRYQNQRVGSVQRVRTDGYHRSELQANCADKQEKGWRNAEPSGKKEQSQEKANPEGVIR